MKLNEYIKSRGLSVRIVGQKMGVTRQCMGKYGTAYTPTVKTLEKMARAMTELGAKTTVVDLITNVYSAKYEEPDEKENE